MIQPTDVSFDRVDQSEYLSVLGYAPADDVKAFASQILPEVGSVEILSKRSELVTLPYFDSKGSREFHMGEVLITEVHVHTSSGADGFGACVGTDVDHAVAIAILDAALASDSAGRLTRMIMQFVDSQARILAEADSQ